MEAIDKNMYTKKETSWRIFPGSHWKDSHSKFVAMEDPDNAYIFNFCAPTIDEKKAAKVPVERNFIFELVISKFLGVTEMIVCYDIDKLKVNKDGSFQVQDDIRNMGSLDAKF